MVVAYLDGSCWPICWYCSTLCWLLLVSVVRPLLTSMDGAVPNMSMPFTVVLMFALFTIGGFTSVSERATKLLKLAPHLSALTLRAIPSTSPDLLAGRAGGGGATTPTGNHRLLLQRRLEPW